MSSQSPETRQNYDSDEKLLIVIDGHALVHRSFHAIQQPLTVSTT